MLTFQEYVRESQWAPVRDRIAGLMVRRGVDPYEYIADYLDSAGVYSEWLGGFFSRLGAAWRAFWSKPAGNLTGQLEAAKKALADLQAMLQQNQQADAPAIDMVLRGLEQSLNIVRHVEPTLKQVEPKLKSRQPGPSSVQLPDDLKKHWMAIHTRRGRIMQMPDDEDKLRLLIANDDELQALLQQLADAYQNIDPSDQSQAQYRQQLGNFLRYVETDAAFRDIQGLLDFARHRTGDGFQSHRPQGWQAVADVVRIVGTRTQDARQQEALLARWYGQLPDNHPVKLYVRQEAQERGEPEEKIFPLYAKYWTTKHPHHMAPEG